MKDSLNTISGYTCSLDKTYYKIWIGDRVTNRITGHIAIVGPSIYLKYICEVIRKRTDKPICYCTINDPDKYFEVECKKYKNVYYFQGDVLNTDDLFNMSMETAYHLIIFGLPGFGIKKKNLDDDITLVLCNMMCCYFQNVPISFELLSETPLKYMSPKPANDFWKLSAQFYPKYYSGEVYLSPLMDKIISHLPVYDTNLEVVEALLSQS